MGLYEDIKSYEDSLAAMKIKIANLQKEADALRNKIALKKELLKKPSVTDHALLRFLERHLEIDMDVARATILTEDVIKAMQLGAKSIKRDGMEIKISGSQVTTII